MFGVLYESFAEKCLPAKRSVKYSAVQLCTSLRETADILARLGLGSGCQTVDGVKYITALE